MSDLSLNLAPTPELLNAAYTQTAGPLTGAGAAGRNRPGADAPAEGSSPGSPFAALLSGVLQGAQPRTPAAGPSDPGNGGAPPLEAQSEDGTDAVALLALPGIAMPLPATPGGPADPGGLFGKTLPVSGNPLPVDLSLSTDSAARAPAAGRAPESDTDASTVPAYTEPGAKRPAISLADLALSRPLEPAPGSADGSDRARADPTVLAIAGRSLAPWTARANQAGNAPGTLSPQEGTENITQSLGAAPAATDGGNLALRLTAADFLRGTFTPIGSTDFLAGQITGQLAAQVAAFTASSDGGSTLPGAASLAGSGGGDTAKTGLIGRPGNMPLPALQPLGDAGSFAGGLADRLLTLGGPGAHSARLQLHPEHLGELNVEIQIDDGSAQVWFGTASSQASDAVQASLPRLRELFADQGIQITRTQVDTGASQMGNPNSGQRQPMAGGAPYQAELPWRPAARTERRSGGGLLPAARPSARLVDVWA